MFLLHVELYSELNLSAEKVSKEKNLYSQLDQCLQQLFCEKIVQIWSHSNQEIVFKIEMKTKILVTSLKRRITHSALNALVDTVEIKVIEVCDRCSHAQLTATQNNMTKNLQNFCQQYDINKLKFWIIGCNKC